MKNTIKKEKGITLIALVVTIVIMLILAGVSLNLVLSEDGIIGKAREGAEKYAQGKENEQKNLEAASNYLNSIVNGKEDEEEDGTDVPIPNGYYYIGGTKNTGFVISDNEADKEKVTADGKVLSNLEGNQWVWVPVDDAMLEKICNTTNTTEYKMAGTTDDEPVKTRLYSKTITIGSQSAKTTITRTTPDIAEEYTPREPDLIPKIDGALQKSGGSTNYSRIVGEGKTLKDMAVLQKNEYETTIKSIQKYKGFYIGRYELAGSADSPEEKAGTVLRYIDWYDSYNACKKIGTKTDGTDKDGIMTRMIWGFQWDAACDFVANKGDKKDITDSSTWGNNNNYNDSNGYTEESPEYISYAGMYHETTGDSEYWKANNIYDLAGNNSEWTQEAIGLDYREIRGDDYHVSGPDYPVTNVGNYNPADTNKSIRCSPNINNHY